MLLIVTVLEGRWPQTHDPLKLAAALRCAAVTVFVIGEAVSLDSLANRDYSDTRERLVSGTIGLGALLIILGAVPPSLRGESRRPLLQNVNADRREMVGRGLAAAITLGVIAALIALALWLPD